MVHKTGCLNGCCILLDLVFDYCITIIILKYRAEVFDTSPVEGPFSRKYPECAP